LRLKLVEADIATGGLLFEIVDVIERVERHSLPRSRERGPKRGGRDPRRPVAQRGAPKDKRSRRRR
jgi:ribonuclease R